MNHKCNKEDVLEIMREDIMEIRKDVKHQLRGMASLKVKASVAGILSGSIGAAVVLALKYIK